ncbi:mitochondrial ribosomal subunit protein domain-containing protein [Ditylenchus destructor]|uniref:Mitochondrial ribosomal subunit protein domain-containing protein n=1 Tax=Ditylenchus destructor TaxID=166010 RepID=A0AAD4NHA5_9BILA|nr:mitochondrial ribosomal subunit protein domain-containing protein [Ditylenchus destructor]
MAQPQKAASTFRQLFIKPKRKLRSQILIETLTGRAEVPLIYRKDLQQRLEVNKPRKLSMTLDQHWPDIWPTAATFKHSVVPLPIRMGYRRHPIRKAPPAAEANLELMKIPNFLHLTPPHIAQHCNAIKRFCTPFPKELTTIHVNQDSNYLPLSVKYSDFVHQGTSLKDIRSRVVTISLNIGALKLDEHAKDKLRRIAARYMSQDENVLTIVCDRCPTRKQNRDYADYLLTALFFESQRLEPWERRSRKDERRNHFKGSGTEKNLEQRFKAVAPPPTEQMQTFIKKWDEYRNNKETPKSTRQYEEAVRELLGIKKIVAEPEEEPGDELFL